MQLEEDILERLATLDNIESVTYTSRRKAAAGGDMIATIPNVLRHEVSVKEAGASGGAYASGDVVFHIHRADLPKSIAELKMGDWLADDREVRYTVLAVNRQRRDRKEYQEFKVQARDLRIVFELEDVITIETPVVVQDSTGAEQVTHWTRKYKDLPCRVQKIDETIAEERAIRGFQGNYTVTVDRELVVTDRDRIVLGTPPGAFAGGESNRTPIRYLEIRGYRAAEAITELPVIDCQEVV
ncbi:MAG: hypothetical protein Q7R45_17660 [Sulfuricaulis sp.]|nr:hypothetical protein [Sulfuricaulis sp.]